MNFRFALLSLLGSICFGCATPSQQQPAATNAGTAKAVTDAAPMQPQRRATITGSRLAPLDNDDPGTHTVSGVTGDDYRHDAETSMCGGPAAGQNPICNSR